MNLLTYLLLIQGSDALKLPIDDESLVEMVDSTAIPWTGDKCTYNIRRATDDSSAVSTFDKYKDARTKWSDPTFADNSNMFYWQDDLKAWKKNHVDRKKDLKGLRQGVDGFKRPLELDKGSSLFGKDGVKPSGAQQGTIGNCWLFNALSGIAEYPERIMKIFTNQELTQSGIYQVKLWYKGEPKLVNLDDSLAVSKYGNPVSA